MTPATISATSIGGRALAALDRPVAGRVAAVFRSTFYVQAGSALMCLGSCDMPAGPLNIVTAAPAAEDCAARGLREHLAVAVSRDEIRVDGVCRVDLSGASTWQPAVLGVPPAPERMAQGLVCLRRAAAGRLPEEGLGRFLDAAYVPDRMHYVSRAAEAALGSAGEWVRKAVAEGTDGDIAKARWPHRLVGLGPGLTPSGDDFLGGMMIALAALGAEVPSRALWSAIHWYAADATNPISLAHMQAAADGVGSEGVHRAIAEIAAGNDGDMDEAMSGIERIGHSSGWDILTGIVTTFDAWLAVGTCATTG
jgi:hypothetical protein